jgi:translation initiation factor IF-1
MPRTDAIKVEGLVVEVLTNKTYRVELANGHRLLGFISGRARLNLPRIEIGNKVKLEVSPCDLSEGRIVAESESL